MPREDMYQRVMNTEGCVEVYFRGREVGYRLKRSELEHIHNARANCLPNQEFQNISGATLFCDGSSIELIFDYPPEVCRRQWEDEIAGAMHDMGMESSG